MSADPIREQLARPAVSYCECNHSAACHGLTADEVPQNPKWYAECSRCACQEFRDDPIYEPPALHEGGAP